MTLENTIISALEELKAVNISNLDVSDMSNFTDNMIIATGNSKPHLDAIAKNVVNKAKESKTRPLGISTDSDWVLIDLGDIIVHVMTEKGRNYYQIDKFWGGNAPVEAIAS